MSRLQCRSCETPLKQSFVDLGMSPLANSYLKRDQLFAMEPFYPLHAFVCGECFLVQLDQYVSREHIFTEYAYFSSYADSWVQHMKDYAHMIARRLDLGPNSFVVEVASNDGYMLQHFVAMGVPVLGIEPAANVAQVAIDFGERTPLRARQRKGQGREQPLLEPVPVAQRFGRVGLDGLAQQAQ